MMLSVDDHAALDAAKSEIFSAYGRDPSFTGCGVGLRRRGGAVTDEPVVIAMVTKKLPAGALSRSRLLPTTVLAGGSRWGVDVVGVGNITLASSSAAASPDKDGPITQKMRPPRQGASVSNVTGKDRTTGTLGCFVRDKSDNTICIFSSSSVIAEAGTMPIGSPVIQPGYSDGGLPSDKVALLKRYVATTYGSTANEVDAAIAQLIDQKSHTDKVADDLMAPISATHPVVGTCVAADELGVNCFLSLIDPALTMLNVELLPATHDSPCTVAPQIGMNIEKVSEGSGYTSSTVAAVGALVKALDPLNNRTLLLKNMIWTQGFFFGGDSGAVACKGGNGRTFVPQLSISICPLLDDLGRYFELPLPSDNGLTDEVKKQFLAQSLVGNLIIGLIYGNADTIVGRVKGKRASADARAIAKTFYKRYRRLLAEGLAHPKSTKMVVTKANIDDLNFAIEGLSGEGNIIVPPLLKPAETKAFQKILADVMVPAEGLDYQRLIKYMNEFSVFERVVAELKKTPTINLMGTVADV
jgi:hypothetical protein